MGLVRCSVHCNSLDTAGSYGPCAPTGAPLTSEFTAGGPACHLSGPRFVIKSLCFKCPFLGLSVDFLPVNLSYLENAHQGALEGVGAQPRMGRAPGLGSHWAMKQMGFTQTER